MSSGAATVMPASFKNWFVHMEELHRRSSNTAVTKHAGFNILFLGEKKTIFNLWICLSKMVKSEIDVNPLRTDFHPLLFPLFVMWNLHRMSRLCQNLNAYANSHLASGLLEKLNPSGMTDQECSVDRTLPPPSPPTDYWTESCWVCVSVWMPCSDYWSWFLL